MLCTVRAKFVILTQKNNWTQEWKEGNIKINTQINKKGTRCKFNVCCACIMINELEQNLNDIVQKNFNMHVFDTSTTEKYGYSYMHYWHDLNAA